MKQIVIGSILFLILSSSAAVMAKSKKHEQCVKTQAKIEKIQSKMRQKYTNKQGVKYRKKLDELYKDEFKYCF